MSLDQSVIAENNATRERLRALVARLSDEALARPLGDGRTIATILGHIAFWDRRVLVLLDHWTRGDAQPSPADAEPEDVDWINDAVQGFLLAMSPRDLAQFALRTAEEVDSQVARVSPELVAAIRAVGEPIALARFYHRGEHLDEIEQLLNESSSTTSH
ncbi:MAG TPA: DinB family protein [Ardenticatenaceae bacterium]|nr:DinB family protein [Ardenticatenaceae bacterium]